MKYWLLIVLMTGFLSAKAGGPWAEGQGKGYVETSALFAVATNTKDHTYQLYAEIGWLEKLTFKAIVPLKNISTPDDLDPQMFEQGSLLGIGNITLGLKYEVMKKKAVMSVGFDTELKTLRSNNALGLRTGYQKYTFRPIYSVGFGIEKLYTYGELKPGFSTNGFGHDVNIVAEVGGKVDENIWLAGYFEMKGVFKNGDFNNNDPVVFASTGFYRDRQNFFTAGIKIAATLVKGFGMNGAVFYGTNVTQSEGGGSIAVKAGIYYDW
ncbi:MAG: hypothetical protein R2730_12315 [Chitinophagales bacterium]